MIAGYTYLGAIAPIRTDYPIPQVRLDHWGGTTGTFAGLDRFGRTIDHRWVNYRSGEQDVFRIQHGYDRASNRLYADNQVYRGASHVYGYDDLHRLVENQAGLINASQSGVESHWQSGVGAQGWTLDRVGNQQSVADRGQAGITEHENNAVNEYTVRRVKSSVAKPVFAQDTFGSNSSANWQKPGSGDAFNVNGTVPGRLVVTTVAQDSFESTPEAEARALLVTGEAIGPVQGEVTLQFPGGSTSGYAGLVFGYRSANDYWMQVVDLGAEEERIYRVLNGVKTQQGSGLAVTVSAGSDYALSLRTTRGSLVSAGGLDLSDGYPSGQMGLVTTVANTQFEDFRLSGNHYQRSLAGRWENHRTGADAGENAIDPTTGRLRLVHDGLSGYRPVLLKGLNLDRFEATFSVKREGVAGTGHGVGLVFNAKDADAFDRVEVFHHDSATVPKGWEQPDGRLMTVVSASTTPGNIPSLSSSSTLWVRVTNDGSNVSVRFATSKGGLSSAGVSFTSSGFSGSTGGQIGFVTAGSLGAAISLGDFEVSADRDHNGSFETLEHVEAFDINGNGYAEEELAYDAAGNLTFDGVFSYTYDAWNRLVKVTKAFRDPVTNELVDGSLISQRTYDGQNRRIQKPVLNSAYLSESYHYHYSSGWQLLETRNTSGAVLKQQVWSAGYIDELVQVAVNGNPLEDPDFDSEDLDHEFRGYWALQDANYNVLGIVDRNGALIERYKYSAYGKRSVYFLAEGYDQELMASTALSRRVMINGVAQAYGLNEFGHQGLKYNDEAEGSLVENRYRILHVDLKRFMQRDPLAQAEPGGGYQDGMNLYQYIGSEPISWLDDLGLENIRWYEGWGTTAKVMLGGSGLRNAGATWKSYYTGAGQGAGAWADGVIPFADPFANQLGVYDSCDPMFHLSQTMGGISRDAALMAAGVGIGTRAAGNAGAGKEFSHFIPNRHGGPRSIWNGNYVSPIKHALSDPYRYRTAPRVWKAVNPMPNRVSQLWNRIPYTWKGTVAAGAGVGAIHLGD